MSAVPRFVAASPPLPPRPLAFALAAGAVAAGGVAGERAGLGLTLALLLVLAAGRAAMARPGAAAQGTQAAAAARVRAGAPVLTVLAVALAVQPVLRDAGWVVAVDVLAALVAAGAVAARPGQWPRVALAVLAPLRLAAGSAVVVHALHAVAPRPARGRVAPVARGVLLGAAGVLVFGALFAAADRAFDDLLASVTAVPLDAYPIAVRVGLGLLFVAAAGAVARAARPVPFGPPPAPHVLGRTELRVALAAVVAVFGVFVGVQLQVLFGGPGYVRRTLGLGYGDYARQGFANLLLVALLTLAVTAIAARRRDPAVRWLLGALLALALVVMVSAAHRLQLVVDAYGLTRVRVAGVAVLGWLVLALLGGLAAIARPALARHLPRLSVGVTLAVVLAFSLANPDARIAGRAVTRAWRGQLVDAVYLRSLSLDALPALRRLPPRVRRRALEGFAADRARPDGWGGLNLARSAAR